MATRHLRHVTSKYEAPALVTTELGRAAKTFRREHRADLARAVGGGECGRAALDLIASASWEFVWSQHFFAEASRLGDPQFALEGHRLADACRLKILSAYEIGARAAEALSRATSAKAATSWAATQPPVPLFDRKRVQAAVDRRVRPRRKRGLVAAAADFGFAANSSVLVVAELDASGVIRVLDITERRPRKGAALRPRNIAVEFAATATRFGTLEITADHHYFEAMHEHLADAGVRLVAASSWPSAIATRYLTTRVLLEAQLLKLPSHAGLLTQLAGVKIRPTASGDLSVTLPRTRGAHGDIVAALVLVVGILHSKAPNKERQ